MTNQDAGEFFSRLAGLTELFNGPGASFSETKAALYFEALRDLPLELVVKGLNAAVQQCTFMPKPAELRTLAVGDAEDQAEAAWMLCKQAMKHAGAYASLAVTDPALGEAIVAVFGSWPAACHLELTPEMWSSKRKEWGRVYRALRARPLIGSRYLPGICEQQNAGRLDWRQYVPVHVLEGVDIRPLSLAEADGHRQQIAAQSHGFSQIGAEFIKGLPRAMDETA